MTDVPAAKKAADQLVALTLEFGGHGVEGRAEHGQVAVATVQTPSGCPEYQGSARIDLGRAQGIGHQRHRIAPLQRVFRTVVDLSDANDDRKKVGVHCSIPCAI